MRCAGVGEIEVSCLHADANARHHIVRNVCIEVVVNQNANTCGIGGITDVVQLVVRDRVAGRNGIAVGKIVEVDCRVARVLQDVILNGDAADAFVACDGFGGIDIRAVLGDAAGQCRIIAVDRQALDRDIVGFDVDNRAAGAGVGVRKIREQDRLGRAYARVGIDRAVGTNDLDGFVDDNLIGVAAGFDVDVVEARGGVYATLDCAIAAQWCDVDVAIAQCTKPKLELSRASII